MSAINSADFDAVKNMLRGPAALQMPTFNDDLSLNTDRLQENIRHIHAGGLRRGCGFLICPSGTGEFQSLSYDEHVQMVETAVAATDGELPVMAGMATSRLDVAIELANRLQKAGAAAIMVPPPFYYKLDEDAFFSFYKTLSSAVNIGIMIYDQVWRNLGTGVSLSMMERLATLPNMIALKYGSPAHFTDMILAYQRFSDRFAFIDNSLAYTVTVSHMHGCQGYISFPASIWPSFELRRWELLEAGQYKEAELLGSRFTAFLHRYLTGDEFGGDFVFHDGATCKAVLEYAGLHGGPVRPPFRALSEKQKQDMYAMLDQIDMNV